MTSPAGARRSARALHSRASSIRPWAEREPPSSAATLASAAESSKRSNVSQQLETPPEPPHDPPRRRGRDRGSGRSCLPGCSRPGGRGTCCPLHRGGERLRLRARRRSGDPRGMRGRGPFPDDPSLPRAGAHTSPAPRVRAWDRGTAPTRSPTGSRRWTTQICGSSDERARRRRASPRTVPGGSPGRTRARAMRGRERARLPPPRRAASRSSTRATSSSGSPPRCNRSRASSILDHAADASRLRRRLHRSPG